MEEFRRLAFKSVTDELKDPSEDEQRQRELPEAVEEKSAGKDGSREQNRGNAESVAQPVDRVLVAGRVLGDPLLAAASA